MSASVEVDTTTRVVVGYGTWYSQKIVRDLTTLSRASGEGAKANLGDGRAGQEGTGSRQHGFQGKKGDDDLNRGSLDRDDSQALSFFDFDLQRQRVITRKMSHQHAVLVVCEMPRHTSSSFVDIRDTLSCQSRIGSATIFEIEFVTPTTMSLLFV